MILFDSHFIVRLKDRDEVAIQELVETYYERINRYLFGLLQNSQIAADLTQETFIRACGAAPRLAAASNVSAWLFRIATNLARQHHHRQQIIRWLPLSDLFVRQESFEHQVSQADLVGYILRQLPNDYRTCLLLQAWSGLDCAEIAYVVGKSEDAVKMTLMRARRRFREIYDQENE